MTATGNVVMYYKNRVLQADKVVYDRANKRVLAEGRVKLTDERHNITYTPKFDLTEDFAAGFADSVEELAVDKTRFTSPRIERSEGGVTVLNQAIYTACEPCKAHPELPPLWQIRAAKIIEDQQNRTIYFEQGWLDLFGLPIAYLPYMSTPDATVIRQTGVLTPYYSASNNYGIGIGVPYFMALAPNYDLTLTPIYYTGQGPAFDAVWRQRLENGKFDIRLSGVEQSNPSTFGMPPSEAGNLKFRGSAQTTGIVNLSDKWTIGWDLNLFTDRWYQQDYKLAKTDPSTWFFGDIVSSAYLRGQDGRAYFDLSGYGFMPTSAYIDLRQEPQATPTLDYHRTFALNPDGTGNIAGEAQRRSQCDERQPRGGALSVGRPSAVRPDLQPLRHLRELYAGNDLQRLPVARASPAITRGRRRRFHGRTSTSIPSAKYGSRSFLRARAGRRPTSIRRTFSVTASRTGSTTRSQIMRSPRSSTA